MKQIKAIVKITQDGTEHFATFDSYEEAVGMHNDALKNPKTHSVLIKTEVERDERSDDYYSDC